MDYRGTPIFCSVADTGLSPSEMAPKKKPAASSFNVYDNPEAAFVTLNLVETNNASLDQILGGFITGHQRGFEMLIEFPGVLLPSFLSSLQALQRMSQAGELPFADLLAPVTSSDGQVEDVEPPPYSREGGFRFDLSCLTNGHALSLPPKEPFDFKTLRQNSTFDDAQASSLVSALTRKLALIQGPPGTGKSYVGINIIKVLLHNAGKARLGPIICVCYTNHALDQLLEHLVDHGVDQIIRIGSRSKSEKLEKLNLKHVVREAERTAIEKRTWWESTKEMDKLIQVSRNLFRQFIAAESLELIKAHLLNINPDHCKELFGGDVNDEDGF